MSVWLTFHLHAHHMFGDLSISSLRSLAKGKALAALARGDDWGPDLAGRSAVIGASAQL